VCRNCEAGTILLGYHCRELIAVLSSSQTDTFYNGVERMSDTSIQITVNGESRDVPEGLFVESLLQFLKIDPSRVAVEHNREIVRKAAWANTRVNSKDQFEIVWFVGGG